MRLVPLLLFIISLGKPASGTWDDVLNKVQGIQDALAHGAIETSTPPLPPRAMELSPRFNRDKLREGIKKLNKRALDKLQKDPPVMQRIQTGTRRDHVKPLGDNIVEVNGQYSDNDILYQHDIVLTDSQLEDILANDEVDKAQRIRRQAENPNYGLWADNTVYYSFNDSMRSNPLAVEAIRMGIAFWQNNTCINFVEDTGNTARDRILFGSKAGCSSMVGRVGGTQDLSIGGGCESVGTVAHELGHALGFWHQMSRMDRDSFITIQWANINKDYLGQFTKQTASSNYNYGMTYDWGSIMQYGSTSASASNLPSMTATDANYQDVMGSDIVAFYDVSMMNERYKCKANCPGTSSVTCLNGGYPHPRNCQVCQCPRGYGGTNCGDRAQFPDGCGQYIKATAEKQTFTGSLQAQKDTNNSNVMLGQVDCSYVFYADPGNIIEVTIQTIATPACTDGCIYGGLEVKAHKDIKMSGYRYCCSNDANKVIRSPYNILPVLLWNKYRSTSVKLSYRAVSNQARVEDGYVAPVLSMLMVNTTTAATARPATVASTTIRTTSTPKRTTPTTTRPTTTSPKCQDRNAHCAEWDYYFNFCRVYPKSFRNMYCPRTCGRCRR
ncbi:unnamed protein product, partial [Mesorhabditis spiculigera]